MNFGQRSLSHPLLVEAIESMFHPVLVYNNKGGPDAALLTRFKEPSWNNPVIRYLDKDGKDLLPRKDRIWTTGGTAQRMALALAAAGREVPEWLRLVALEESEGLAKAAFAMHCFWEGEARLGNLAGVAGTRSGWLDGEEVVEVEYDPDIVKFDALVDSAASLECASFVYAGTEEDLAVARKKLGDRARPLDEAAKDAKQSDRKYSLRQTPLRHLPLTPAQASKVNAALRLGADTNRWLSPGQQRLLAVIKQKLEADPDLLAGFVAPERSEDLPGYQSRLLETLGKSDE